MYDELTRQDIQKMQEEIDYRVQTLRPKLIEDVQTARAFGDLSENFEYKCAKQEKNRNDSRIRYLQRMIKTARVIEDHSRADTAGLYDTVEILMENTGKTRKIQLVTTLRQDALKGLISKESPVGRALMGHKAGDRVQVTVSPDLKYTVEIRKIEKGAVANPAAHTYDVRATLDNAAGELLPGMVCRVTVSPAESAEEIAVPLRAVQQAGDGSRFVWTVRGDSAVRTAVTTGRLVNNGIVLTGGVAAGDRIVVDGMQKIGEGSKVVWR